MKHDEAWRRAMMAHFLGRADVPEDSKALFRCYLALEAIPLGDKTALAKLLPEFRDVLKRLIERDTPKPPTN